MTRPARPSTRRPAPRRLRGPAPDVRARRLDRPRLPAPPPTRHGSTRRERAQAQRLAYGAVQRRGTSRPPDRACSPAARPTSSTRRCWPRCGSASTSCSSPTPRPTTPPSTRRSSWRSGRRGERAPGRRAPMPRGARQRRPAPRGRRARRAAGRRSTTRPRQGAAVAPLLPRVAGADVVGGARSPPRRGSLHGRDERARRDGAAGEHAAAPTRARSWASCGPPETSVERPDGAGAAGVARGDWSSRGRLASRSARDGSRPASWSPQARGSQAVVAVLDPQPGERVLDLCAGAGDQDDRDRRPDGATAARSSPSSSTPAGPASCASSASGWASLRRRGRGGRCRAPTSAAATIGSSWIRPAPTSATLASRPDARWRKSPELIERAGRDPGGRSSPGPPAPCAPAGTLVYSTCTISARENEERSRALLADDAASTRPTTSAPPTPSSPRAREPRFLQTAARPRPHRRVLHRPAAPRRARLARR